MSTAASTKTAPKNASATAPTSAAATAAPTPRRCDHALLVIGTYHSVMAGLILRRDKFLMKFSVKHHVGSLNAVAATDKYIATSGVDERIFLFTNKAQQRLSPVAREKLREAGQPLGIRLADLGSLAPPAEATCLRFTEGSQHLLCGLGDGQLLAYRTRDWSVALSLPVHERAVRAVGCHPRSGGALVVTVGDDRAVAVLDLARARLMTKWKYTSVVQQQQEEEEATASEADEEEDDAANEESEEDESASDASDSDDEDDDDETVDKKRKITKKKKASTTPSAAPPAKRARAEAETKSEEDAPRRRGRLAPHALRLLREDPLGVVFTPSGDHFAVFARFSAVVYRTATAAPLGSLVLPSPQPSDELHALLLLDDAVTLLVGDEAGRLRRCTISATGAAALEPVPVNYPSERAAEAKALLGAPVNAAAEARARHPLRHVSRVKALWQEGATLFSMDSSGIVIAWLLQTGEEGAALRYVTSANCQGRPTALSVLSL